MLNCYACTKVRLKKFRRIRMIQAIKKFNGIGYSIDRNRSYPLKDRCGGSWEEVWAKGYVEMVGGKGLGSEGEGKKIEGIFETCMEWCIRIISCNLGLDCGGDGFKEGFWDSWRQGWGWLEDEKVWGTDGREKWGCGSIVIVFWEKNVELEGRVGEFSKKWKIE